MEIINLTPNLYKQWDDFCLESDEAWFLHTTYNLEYMTNYKPALRSESKSFMVKKDKNIIAVCPLVLEINEGIKEFSLGGDYGLIPALANFLTPKEQSKTQKLIFDKIDKLAEENNIKRTLLRFPVLSKAALETGKQRYNYLMKFGYLDNSLNTQVLDLSKSLDELRIEVRHGHDYDIDRAARALKAEIFDQYNITEEVFEAYVNLHRLAAGRVTRPRITFDLMLKFIKKGNGFLVGVKKDEAFVGFSLFSLFKGNAYYGSSANNREVEKIIPISHFIQWSAIEWMKQKGCKFYETGWQKYGLTLSNFPDAKQINISKFQRGFGGFTAPLFRGEKYYDREYFLKIYEARIKIFGESIK
ncbi:MAG: hypothetical protein Q8O93_03535 [bacterium]|nr:hypothetical protein [bacterium]